MEDDGCGCADKRAHTPRKFKDCDLLRIADVGGLVLVRFEQAINSINQVGNVTEAACLLTVAIHSDGFAAKRLIEKVWQCTAVVQTHARAVGVKDADDVSVHPVMAVISHS